jgi:hypothetical protein
MSKPEDVPQGVWESALSWASVIDQGMVAEDWYPVWQKELLVETIARAIMTESDRCAKIAETVVVEAFLIEDLAKEDDTHIEGRDFMRDHISQAIRNGGK